jgi:hypothetical protein
MWRNLRRKLRQAFKPALSLMLAVTVLLTGIPILPGFGVSKVLAATTGIAIDPNHFYPVYGGYARIKWYYDDRPHATTLEICTLTPRPLEPLPPEYETPTPYYRTTVHTIGSVPQGGDKDYQFDWYGKDTSGTLLKAGTYTLCIVPSGAEDYFGYVKDGVTIDNPAPPAPKYIRVDPDKEPANGTHTIRGIAERGTRVTLQIRYTKRVGVDQVPGDVETYTFEVPFDNNGKDNGSHLTWSRDLPMHDYFEKFPHREDNKPQKYVREWAFPVKLHEYEIAHISASVERLETNPYFNAEQPEKNKSGMSEITKVLRYVAPDWNINWGALAGYYYKADSASMMKEGAEKIAWDNVEPDDAEPLVKVCTDDQKCLLPVPYKWNLIIQNPELAGQISQLEFQVDLSHEKIANRNKYPKPLWWDPINLATGDFDFRHTNMTVQGAMPLEFTITLNFESP